MISFLFIVRRSYCVRVRVCLVFGCKDWRLWCMVSFMFLVRRSSLCESSGMFGICWQGFGFCGGWLALRVFDIRLYVRVQECLVFVAKAYDLWCMARFMILARRSSLCESSGMFGLCW